MSEAWRPGPGKPLLRDSEGRWPQQPLDPAACPELTAACRLCAQGLVRQEVPRSSWQALIEQSKLCKGGQLWQWELWEEGQWHLLVGGGTRVLPESRAPQVSGEV